MKATTCQMSNVCCAMCNVLVKAPNDLLTRRPNPRWENDFVIWSLGQWVLGQVHWTSHNRHSTFDKLWTPFIFSPGTGAVFISAVDNAAGRTYSDTSFLRVSCDFLVSAEASCARIYFHCIGFECPLAVGLESAQDGCGKNASRGGPAACVHGAAGCSGPRHARCFAGSRLPRRPEHRH